MLNRKLAVLVLSATLLMTGCGASRIATPAKPLPAPTQPAEGRKEAPKPACTVPKVAEPQQGASVYYVYFHCGDDEKAYAVPRVIAAAPATPAVAMTELLKGPTAEEKQAGFTSWFSEKTAGKLKSITVDANGKAVVDFANFAQIIPNASSSFGGGMLKRELGYTLAQFKEIKEIEYRFDGSCDAFGDWQQSGCTVLPASAYK